MLPTIAPKLARFLGPKGLMPVAKRGTVREDVAEAIAEARGLLDWKGDKQGHIRAGKSGEGKKMSDGRVLIRTAVARTTFPVTDVEANVRHFVKAVKAGQAALASDNTSVKRGECRQDRLVHEADPFQARRFCASTSLPRMGPVSSSTTCNKYNLVSIQFAINH